MKTERKEIHDLALQFSFKIFAYRKYLVEQREYVISNQLYRSGTSIGANSSESKRAESMRDYTHKFKIAAKEAEETEYWLLLCAKAYDTDLRKELLEDLAAIKKVLNSIIFSKYQKRK